MLKFYYGTKLEKLADHLLGELRVPLANPLAPEVLVVQNHGIGQWFSLYMAQNEGIAANLKFEFPSERIWSMIRLLNPDIPKSLPSDRGPMTWSIMELLQDEQFLVGFENLRHYIEEKDPRQRAMRSWKLASKIADVFDQYLVYRPEMILDWEKGKLQDPGSETEQWQQQLWRRLLKLWEENSEELPHRARLQHRLVESIEEKTLDVENLPERVTVFGVSSASPYFIKTMAKLSSLTDVLFYQLAIDPKKKQSAAFHNPLLQSMGNAGASFIAQLASCVKADREIARTMEWECMEGPSAGKKTVFSAMQSDLRRDSSLSGRNLKVPPADGSIQVHSCHSPMREVEVLYDQLLAVLDQDPDLSPDDILIMTPDIETYASLVEAVFNTPDDGQPEIPFSIADRGIQGAHPAIESFLSILELCESRFKVSEVLDLLDSTPVQQAFGFSDEDLNTLEKWIRDNNIRWGIDAPFKRNINVPESDGFTWQAGLDRLLLGYMMKPGDDHLHGGIFPYDEVETSGDAELAGKFSRFLNILFEISRRSTKTKTPKKWARELALIPDTFLPDIRDYFWEISQIRAGLDQLSKYAGLGGYNNKVPFRIVRSWLQEQLEEQTTGGGRIGRGVTFSSLMPMRTIPFKMIGILGMNEGAFPRTKIPIEFDLIQLNPLPGDSIRSEEDRYLFLENLLSARSHLYFSYVGQSNRQDAKFPPSVVLKEFLDYLEEHYDLKSDDLLTRHPLQPFSPSYFNGDKWFSYSKTQRDISRQLVNGKPPAQKFFEKELPEPDQKWKKLSLGDLISFFQHPTKFMLQNRLGIYLNEERVLNEDREPFVLDGLGGYQVGQELLDRFMKEKPLDPFEKNLNARDMLPEGWCGTQAFAGKLKDVREFGTKIKTVLDQQQLDSCEVNLEIGDFQLVGKLFNVYESDLLSYRFGKMRPKDLIDVWIKHLVFQQVKPDTHEGYSCLLTKDKKDPFASYRFSPMNNGQSILKELLEMYWQGIQSGICFFPETSHAYSYQVCCRGKEHKYGHSKAASKWTPTYGSFPGEGDDPYNKLIMGSKKPMQDPRFSEISKRFWAPVFEALNRGDD